MADIADLTVMPRPPELARRVVCAAVRLGGKLIVCGPRHLDATMHEVIRALPTHLSYSLHGAEQGFVDQRGAFLTRAEALEVALAASQIIRRCGGDETALYSENLY